MARPVRIIFYAINGTGLGHLSRLLHLARAAKEVLDVLKTPADFHFITTSEAAHLATDFPVYKFPSKSVVRSTGVDPGRFVQATKLTIANLIAHLHPDLLVLDTEPQGAFQELTFVRGYAKATAFIDRHKDPKIANAEVHRRHLALYDRILVPDDPDQAARYPASPPIEAKRRFIGRVHGFRPEHALPWAEARRQLGIPDDGRAIYLSAGGGGDPTAEAHLHTLIDALLALHHVHLVIGYGPLYRGEKRRGPRITALGEPNVWRFFGGIDVAVSAAGYNSFFELLAAHVPTVFFALAKGMDRQDERIAWGVERGLCHRFEGTGGPASLEPDVIRATVSSMLEGPLRVKVQEALETRRLDRGAIVGGTELLSLVAAQPGSGLDRNEVCALGAWRMAWSFETHSSFVESAQWTRFWQKRAYGPTERDDVRRTTAAAFEARQIPSMPDLALGSTLARWQENVDRTVLERLVTGWTAELATEGPRRQRLQDALDAFEDAPGASRLLTALIEGVSPREGAERLRRLIAALDAAGGSWPQNLPNVPLDRRGFEDWLSAIAQKDREHALTNEG